MTRLDEAGRGRIEAVLYAGDMPAALALADAALAAGHRDPLLFNLVAWRAEEAYDFAAAHAALAQAMALVPHDATIVTAAGRALRKQGRMADACAMFDRAQALDPGFAVPWLERGFAFDASGDVAAAGAAYLRAAELDPGLALAWAGAASMAARQGDPVAVEDFAARALAIDPASAVAHNALAASAIEQGDAAAAATRLRALLAHGGATPEDRIAALTLLGDALDKLDAPADAFAAWSSAKAAFATFHGPRFAHHEPQRRFIERLEARVAAVDAARWQQHAAPAEHGPARGHVFLLGYPRSGTTLVENVLASAPGVVALEERPTFADADEYLVDDDGIDRLLALDAAGRARLRDAYWRRVAANGVAVAGKLFVDMNPMNGMKLPLIARLFPDARIVVMRRDPRDIVLSCFRQNFRVGAPALAFTTLGETARHYAATTAMTEACLAAMPLARHVVRYDALVGDFDRVTQDLCAFAGIAWSEDLRRFDRTARRRGVTTASVTQVRRGLYDGGGAWRRYAAELAPVLPVLAPWLERFGFEPYVAPGATHR